MIHPSDYFPFQTVDPRYQHFFKLAGLLIKLDVINVTGQKKHSFSIAGTLLGQGQMPQPKGHWIPMATVSLSADFIEIEFGPGRKRSL